MTFAIKTMLALSCLSHVLCACAHYGASHFVRAALFGVSAMLLLVGLYIIRSEP